MNLSFSKHITQIILLAFVYIISAKLGLLLAFEPSNVNSAWPPTGLSLAAILWGGLRLWPGIFIGALLTCLYDSFTVPLSLSIAVGNTLEVVTASYFILRFASARPFFKTIHTAVFIIALFGSTMISASIGVGSLFFADLIQQNNLLLVWKTWWLRDLVGGLILTPFLLTWLSVPSEDFTKKRLLEALLLLFTILCVLSLFFSQWSQFYISNELMIFVLLPILAWSILRFHHHGATLVVMIISTAAVLGTENTFGSFALINESESLFTLQIYMGAVMFTTLLLTASQAERQQAYRLVRLSRRNLEATVKSRTQALNVSNELLAKEMQQQRQVTDSLKALLYNIDNSANLDFYSRCAQALTTTYNAKYAFIGLFTDDKKTASHTLAFWNKGTAGKNFTYTHLESPCRDILNNTVEIIPEHATKLYPNDKLLASLGVESFFGSPLKTSTGDIIGIIAIMDTKPLLIENSLKSILGLFANKVALEVQRRKITEELELAASVFNESLEAIIICDANTNIIRVNPEFTKITGYSLSEVKGYQPSIIKSGIHSNDFYKNIWVSIIEKGFWQGEITNRRKNGENFVSWQIIKAVKDSTGNIQRYMSIFSDITEKKKAEEHIFQLAHNDLITQLPNRAAFHKQLNDAIITAAHSTYRLAVMFIDLDHFKLINDTSGHPVGDELLQQVALRFKEIIGSNDIISRFGGDEFTVLLPCIETIEEVSEVANKILDSLLSPFALLSCEVTISASIGVGIYPDNAKDASSLLSCADNAMYSAKNSGRASCHFYTEQMQIDAHERVVLERDLRDALTNDQFVLHYQPQFDVKTNQIIGVEALLRWQHPTKGLIPPDTFIPVAEVTGLIVPIGQWIINEACQQLAHWRSEGAEQLTMSINLSARQFFQKDLLYTIETAINSSGVPASKIGFEITESMMMINIEETIETLHQIKGLGVQLFIDDFGTGYSSLSYLKRFPLNKLKIDKSFVDGLPNDLDDLAIVQAIIGIAHSLNLTVIAEGVETAQQYDILTQYHCNEIQGYYFSKPLLSEAAGRFIKKNNTSASQH
jgi:diguanylate cyclase (GGDEF)-like protein/PAS domain S-box-containing protein